MVTVIVPPGVTAVGSASDVTVSRGSWTVAVAVHCAARLPGTQVLPSAVEVATEVIVRSPVTGFLTVNDSDTVAVAPTGRSPVQVSTAPLTLIAPDAPT